MSIPRNRVRAELLPLLVERFNPSVVDALAGAAEIAREEWSWMSREAQGIAATAVSRDGDRWSIDAEALGARPLPLIRVVVYQAMTAAARGAANRVEEVDRVVDLVRFGGPPFDAHGQRAERIAWRCRFNG